VFYNRSYTISSGTGCSGTTCMAILQPSKNKGFGMVFAFKKDMNNFKKIFDYDNRYFWKSKHTGKWKWFVGYNLQNFLEENWEEDIRRIQDNWDRESEERRIKAEEQYIRDNPHIVLLEQLPEKEGEEATLQLIDIYYKKESAVYEAYKTAFQENMDLFQELSDIEFPLERIFKTNSFYFAKEAYKGTVTQMVKLFMEDSDEYRPETETIIESLMPDFDNIALLDDHSIQQLLRRVDTGELARALKLADEKTQDKIFENMSSLAVELLIEDMFFIGPTGQNYIQEAQDKIISVLPRLKAAGEIDSLPWENDLELIHGEENLK